jgi:hypothetical protein
MELSFLVRAATFLAAVGGAGCLDIVGTRGFEPCDDCGAGGAGGDDPGGGAAPGGTAGSTSATGATTATGSTGAGTGTCADVTVTVAGDIGDVRVEIDPDDVDFDAGESRTQCIALGPKTITAECDPDEGDRFPIDVDWGTPLCARGSTCSLELTGPLELVVTGAECR